MNIKSYITSKQLVLINKFFPPFIVFVVALVARLIVTFEFNLSNPLFDFPVIDALTYDSLARTLIETGRWNETGAFYQPPLYPLFLAGVYKFLGDSYLWPRIIQSFIGSFSCLILFYISKGFVDKSVGFLAGIICALYGPLIYFELDLLSPVLAVFFSLAGLILFYRGLEELKIFKFVFSGLLTGLAVIAWPLTGVFVFACITATFIRFKKKLRKSLLFSLLIIIGAIIPVIPVSVLNLMHGEFVLISTNGPPTFYAANNLKWKNTVLFRPGYDWEKMINIPFELYSEKEINEIGNNRLFLKESINYIRNNPGHYLKALMTKTTHLFNAYEIMNPTDMYFFKQYSPFLDRLIFEKKYLKFPFGILLPFAVIGIFFSFIGKKRYNFLFLLYFFWGGLGLILFCISARFRLIIIPVMSIYAAIGMIELTRMIYSKKKLGDLFIIVLFAICSYCVANFDIFKQKNFFESPVVKSQSFFAMGEVKRKQKKYKQAASWYLKSIEIDRNYSDAWVELGLVKYEMGDTVGAIQALSTANEIAPDYPIPLYNLGYTYYRSLKSDISSKEKAIYFFSEYLKKANKFYIYPSLYRKQMEFAYNCLKVLNSL